MQLSFYVFVEKTEKGQLSNLCYYGAYPVLWSHSDSLLSALLSEAQRKYEDNCDSLHEESVSETAENSGEEAGEGALDVEAGEMTDGGEDDYDEEGSHHLVRETVDRG